MGYQEVIFQIKRKSDIEKISKIYSKYIDLDIITLLAVFKSKINYKKIKKNKIYTIYGTERHPGADSLYIYAKEKHHKCLNMDNYIEYCRIDSNDIIIENEKMQLIEMFDGFNNYLSVKHWDKQFNNLKGG